MRGWRREMPNGVGRNHVDEWAELVLVVAAHIVRATGIEPLVGRHEIAALLADVRHRRQDDAGAQVPGEHDAARDRKKARRIADEAGELLRRRRAEEPRRRGHRGGQDRATIRVERIVDARSLDAQAQRSLQPALPQRRNGGQLAGVEEGAERGRVGAGGTIGDPVAQCDRDVGRGVVRDGERSADLFAQVDLELAVSGREDRQRRRVVR